MTVPFWTYLRHCAGRSFVIGPTDNRQTGMAQRETDVFPGSTQNRRPIKLVWSQQFGTRMEAIEAERQIKGWSRAKKLALIREDWKFISILARSTTGK